MPFVTWADYLCDHKGSQEINQDIATLGKNFEHGSIPTVSLRGEEATLFLGISADGSPLFLYHLEDLGSTKASKEPNLIAIVGLQ
jgi:hypothetical protein